ncbi:glutamate receptor ionotropic, kainate 3-like [Haliotis cracherodii]|uniref:glutamate receptor ionotropic, kainate 3-like n=1 Tax=Haliotis cracherodii TaxID=6455 RepID=UPI0039ECA504
MSEADMAAVICCAILCEEDDNAKAKKKRSCLSNAVLTVRVGLNATQYRLHTSKCFPIDFYKAGVSQLLESTDVILYANLRVGPETTRAFLKGNLKHVQLLKSRHRNYLVICGRICITEVIDVNHTADNIEVNTLMWVPRGRQWRQVNMKTCREKCSLAAQIFPNSVTGYNGRQLTVALMEWRQFIIKSESNGSTIYKGHCIDLLDIMAYLLNFTYVLVEPPDRRWGVEIDGHWDGIVRQLIDREVDFTVAPLAMSSERQRVIDFLSTPISYEYSDVAFRRLDQTVSKWRLLLDLFHPKVYLCLAVALVTVNVVISIRLHVSPPTSERYLNKTALPPPTSGLIPRTGSGRMLVSSWCLFSVIMASIFSGKLIATLAVPKTPTPFHSLTELLDSEQYTLGIVGGEAHQQFISESTDDVLLRLWHTIMKHNKTDPSVTSSNVSKHMDRVLLGEYALVYTRYKEETPWSCDVDFLGQKIAVFTASLAMPKNSPIASDFNKL